MKTKEELNALKEEVETLNKKLHELTDEELEQVTGGTGHDPVDPERKTCMWGYGGYSRYNPVNDDAPQICGNCLYYYQGTCLGGSG